MQYEQAIVVCAFGWGKEFRLYKETLYVCDKAYRLASLTQVQLKTQQTLGVPSAYLELRFGRERVVLRGIAAVEDARRAAEYLIPWCGEGQRKIHEQITHLVCAVHVPQLSDNPQTGPKRGWDYERKTEHLAILPIISVPVRLECDEQAYYSSRATRCGELIRETRRSTYPAQDHGLLILTDRRLLFIGRRSQLVLEFAHLQHIVRLEGGLAFEADHWQKRAIFTMQQTDLCIARLESILHLQAMARLPGTSSLSPHRAQAHLVDADLSARPGW